MKLAIRRYLESDRGRKHARYIAASGISVVVGQAVLAATFGIMRWPAELSNVAAFAVATVVAFLLQRRWTWRRTGRASLVREVLPFWMIASIGLLGSTVAVSVAEEMAGDVSSSRATQTGIIVAASLAAYGTLWIAKFVVFDRFLFRSREA